MIHQQARNSPVVKLFINATRVARQQRVCESRAIDLGNIAIAGSNGAVRNVLVVSDSLTIKRVSGTCAIKQVDGGPHVEPKLTSYVLRKRPRNISTHPETNMTMTRKIIPTDVHPNI